MADRKIIAVVGATGAQGGGLVRALLADESGAFGVRALTRDPESDKGKDLARRGAEVVAADIDDAASVAKAFEGAHGAFCLTNFWEHFSAEREVAQVNAMAQAAKRAGVRHVIWSTLEDTRRFVPLDDDRMPTLQGKYKVPHFDGKGEADHLFADAGVPTTYLLTSFYWDNLVHFGMGPRRNPDGTLSFVLPMGDRKLPGIAVEDIGRCAFGVFRKGNETIGKRVGIAGEHLTGAQMAAVLSRALGQPVRHDSPPFETYRGLGFPGADDLGNMFQFKHDFEETFCASRPVEATRALNPALQSFETWAQRNASRIPIS